MRQRWVLPAPCSHFLRLSWAPTGHVPCSRFTQARFIWETLIYAAPETEPNYLVVLLCACACAGQDSRGWGGLMGREAGSRPQPCTLPQTEAREPG